MDEPLSKDLEASTNSPHWFTTTHWSVVLQASASDSSQSSRALEKLCRAYWLPLYTFIRRQGYGPHDSQDLTQGFFYRLLRADSLAAVSPDKGKFRTFLLAALKHFLSDQRDHDRAMKRGGGEATVCIVEDDAEQRYQDMPIVDAEAEKTFDRRWGLTVLEQAVDRLRSEYLSSGRSEIF